MFFKRLSRSRSNSQSYVDSYHSPHDSKTNSASYDYSADKYSTSAPVSAGADSGFPNDDRRGVPSSRQSNTAPAVQISDPLAKETGGSASMYPRQSQPTEVSHRVDGMYNPPPPTARGVLSNGNGYGNGTGYDNMSPQKDSAAPPDLLLQAFNQALRPHMDKVDGLENEINDLRAYIDTLEQQRSEVHAWIDKRGLRPGTQ